MAFEWSANGRLYTFRVTCRSMVSRSTFAYSTHAQLFHTGVNCTLTAVRQVYWIPTGRQYVKVLLRCCVICKKHSGKPHKAPDMAPLSKVRLQDMPPFTVTGINFTGALYVRQNHTEGKVYICQFTCATTRAVHLEVVKNLSVETFLLAFCRFFSRKSLPQVVISDNASTYLLAAEELINNKLLNSVELETAMERREVVWRFITKRALWHGGYWERFIGLTKTALKRVFGRAHINLITLQTLVVEIENILKNRPLTYSMYLMTLMTWNHLHHHICCTDVRLPLSLTRLH